MLHLCIPVTCKCINTFHTGWINGPLSGAVYHILIQSFDTSADAIRILTSFQIGRPPAYRLENAVVKIGKPYDVIKWKHFPCYWPFVRGIHWSSSSVCWLDAQVWVNQSFCLNDKSQHNNRSNYRTGVFHTVFRKGVWYIRLVCAAPLTF